MIELAESHVVPELRVLTGKTERQWIADLSPDLNAADGDEDDSSSPAPDRDRLNIDLSSERARWEKAAKTLHMKLTPFVKLAVEEKIRRDGLA